mgnify:CR=1 FL=1
MVTLLDVAARAGVSRSTVSLVINKSPLVKDETRQRVERAIQELGYVPNPNARGLVKKENKSLGVIIAIEDQPYNTYESIMKLDCIPITLQMEFRWDWRIQIMDF